MPLNAQVSIIADSIVLLNRALQGKTIACFGADGNGQHGRRSHPKYFACDAVVAVLAPTAFAKCCEGFPCQVHLHSYDASSDGHILTDENFKISVNNLLQEHYIDVACWEYGPLAEQGTDYVSLRVFADRLE